MDNKVLKEKLFEAVKQKGLITEQANSGKKDFAEMISLLLHSKTQAHTFHLQCKSYAEHMALNGYYTSIDELTDALVESYQGKYSILKGYKNYPIEDYKDTTTTINYLKDLCEKVEELRLKFPEGIQTTIPYDTSDFVKATIKEVFKILEINKSLASIAKIFANFALHFASLRLK